MSKPDFVSNASFAMLANALYLFTRLVLPPLILSYLSLAEYGLWSACFVLIMYIGLTDVGFASVYVRFCAQFYAQGDFNAINRLLSTGVYTLAGLAIVVWLGLWAILPWVFNCLQIEPIHHHTAQWLILGTAAMFLLDLTLGAYCYLLHGLQQIRAEKKVAMVGFLIEPILICLFLMLGCGVFSLLYAFVLRYLWSLLAFIRLAHCYLPSLSIRPHYYSSALLKHFLGFGLNVQLSTLLGTFLFSLDKLLAGILLGPKGIALIELGSKLPISAIAVPSTISNVAMPTAADLATRQQYQALFELYQSSTRSVALLASLPLAFMAAFSSTICLMWLGTKSELNLLPQIMLLCCLCSQLHISTGPGSAIFRALGKVNNEFTYHGLRIVLIAIGLFLAWLFGQLNLSLLTMVLCGTNALAAAIYLWFNQHKLEQIWEINTNSNWISLLTPALSAYPLAWGLAYMFDIQKFWQLVVVGCIYCLLWCGLVWLQLNSKEKATVMRVLKPLLWRLA